MATVGVKGLTESVWGWVQLQRWLSVSRCTSSSHCTEQRRTLDTHEVQSTRSVVQSASLGCDIIQTGSGW